MATRTPGLQLRNQYQRNWGNYPTAALLPNTAGTPLSASQFKLEEGDEAYVIAEGVTYVCTSAGGIGAAPASTWAAASGGKFAPRYIVGNTLAPFFDPALDQGPPFTYFHDPGDGTGIAAALAAAAVVPGDVWIRPGFYDFNMLTSPATPLTIPQSCRVSGIGLLLDAMGNPAAQIISPTTGNQCMFVMQAATALRDICIVQPFSAGPFVGAETGLIECGDAAQIENCVFFMNTSDTTAPVNTHVHITGDALIGIESCVMLQIGSPRLGTDPNAWSCIVKMSANGFLVVDKVAAGGADVGFWQGPSGRATLLNLELVFGFFRRGIYQDEDAYVYVDDNSIFAANDVDAIGAELRTLSGAGGMFSKILSSQFFGTGTMTNMAIIVRGDPTPGPAGRTKIQGCDVVWDRAGASIEIGDATSATDEVDRCLVQDNTIINGDAAGVGVQISNANDNGNGVQNNSIEAATPVVDGGTASQIGGNW